MAKVLIHNFTIRAASASKIKRNNKPSIIGGKREAVVIKDDNGVLKARLITSPVEGCNDKAIYPFTSDSLNLKGKLYAFLKDKDKYGHHVCIIRDINTANNSPGLDIQYDVLREGLLISGYTICKNGMYYFDYKELIAFTEHGARINKAIVKSKHL